MGNGFAMREGASFYLRLTTDYVNAPAVREPHLSWKDLESQDTQDFVSIDERGRNLIPRPFPHLGFVGRGPHMLLNTGEALYGSSK
jgi:hypothetical protein